MRLSERLKNIETKIRRAYRLNQETPNFLPKPKRERSIDDVIDSLAYGYDQYWTIIAILANFPTLQGDDDISTAVKRLVDIWTDAERERNELANKLEQEKKISKMWYEKYNRSADNETVLFHQALKAQKEQYEAQSKLAAMRRALEDLLRDCPPSNEQRVLYNNLSAIERAKEVLSNAPVTRIEQILLLVKQAVDIYFSDPWGVVAADMDKVMRELRAEIEKQEACHE